MLSVSALYETTLSPQGGPPARCPNFTSIASLFPMPNDARWPDETF